MAAYVVSLLVANSVSDVLALKVIAAPLSSSSASQNECTVEYLGSCGVWKHTWTLTKNVFLLV